jgi:hypothetical protein
MLKEPHQNDLDHVGVSELCNHMTVVVVNPGFRSIMDSYRRNRDFARVITEMSLEMAGDVRMVITLLGLLNTFKVSVGDMKAKGGSRIVRGRVVPYMEVHRLTVELPKDRMFAAVDKHMRTAGILRRAHEVLGHWCYRRAGYRHPCPHDWERTHSTKLRFRCKRCASERWWRDAHQRGDASRGFVKKEYDLVSRYRRRFKP